MSGTFCGQEVLPEPWNKGPAEQIAAALANLKSGKFNSWDIEIIRQARAVFAVSDLEKQFPLVTDKWDKAKIAAVLLSFGDRKDVYWDYLVELAKPALESDVPSLSLDDAKGKSEVELKQAIETWAKAHGKTMDEAGRDLVYEIPGGVGFLGMSGDPRAIPLLRRAFASPNSMIQLAAAEGLAELHDVASVHMIIERCRNASPELASAMAQSLVYFDDPEAQKTVDTYVPKDVAKELRQRRMSGLRR